MQILIGDERFTIVYSLFSDSGKVSPKISKLEEGRENAEADGSRYKAPDAPVGDRFSPKVKTPVFLHYDALGKLV